MELRLFCGFLFGKIVTYLCVSQSISVAKTLWGGLEDANHMMCFILCESLPQPLESYRWDGDDVCSYVVNYGCAGSLDLDSRLRSMDIFT